MQIRVYETVSQKPNGDRDTRTHPSSSFEVVLVNGDRRYTTFQNNQYDGRWGGISGTRTEYLNEAMKAASDLAEVLGTCEIVGVNLTKYEKEVMDLEAKIKVDTARLIELKKRVL